MPIVELTLKYQSKDQGKGTSSVSLGCAWLPVDRRMLHCTKLNGSQKIESSSLNNWFKLETVDNGYHSYGSALSQFKLGFYRPFLCALTIGSILLYHGYWTLQINVMTTS